MKLLIMCAVIHGFGLPGWLYVAAGLLWLVDAFVTWAIMASTVKHEINEMVKKAAEYQKALNKK